MGRAPRVRWGWIYVYLGLISAAAGSGASVTPASLAEGTAALERGDTAAALEIYRSIIAAAPDSGEAAFAADTIADLAGRRLFPDPSAACSEEALTHYRRAEAQFAERKLEQALPEYRRAIELCPKNARWWIHAGDAYYGMGEYARARDLFQQGLELDPWNRAGRKYLADTELQLGNLAASYRNAILAVVSDPTYESGWHLLRELTTGLGGRWLRTFVEKPSVAIASDQLELHLSAGQGPEHWGRTDEPSWREYLRLRASLDHPDSAIEARICPAERKPSPQQWRAWSPLEREQLLVQSVVGADQAITASSSFWQQMSRASEAGFAKEAIFLHLMDKDLAGTYPEFRQAHAKRLMQYITEVLAPLPEEDSRHA